MSREQPEFRIEGTGMRTIGITGGVGAGKSELLKYLASQYNCRQLPKGYTSEDI